MLPEIDAGAVGEWGDAVAGPDAEAVMLKVTVAVSVAVKVAGEVMLAVPDGDAVRFAPEGKGVAVPVGVAVVVAASVGSGDCVSIVERLGEAPKECDAVGGRVGVAAGLAVIDAV